MRATLARILNMPSVDWSDTEGFLVRDVLPRKRQHPGYAAVLASMRAGVPPSPVEFRRDPYTCELMLGDGHHRVAAAQDLGWPSLPYYIDD